MAVFNRLRNLIKRVLLSLVSRLTKRHAVLLPQESSDEACLFSARGEYRVSGSLVKVRLTDERLGTLTIEVLAYEGFFPSRRLWRRAGIQYKGPTVLTLSLQSGQLHVGEQMVGVVPMPIPSRRFSLQFELTGPGFRARRLTGHYVAINDQVAESNYYEGDDYVDYEAQSAGEHDTVLSLMHLHEAHGPVLDIGCATGGLVERLMKEGFEATGLDQSSWAIEKAKKRVGEGRLLHGSIEDDETQSRLLQRGPFRTIVMWAVFEHFHNPPRMLSFCARIAKEDALLLINTTNARSLSSLVFKEDWEGYYDWTHHGVDQVTPESLKAALDETGWNLLSLNTHAFWQGGADPDNAVLRDLYGHDSRFRELLQSRDFGDFILCVARRK